MPFILGAVPYNVEYHQPSAAALVLRPRVHRYPAPLGVELYDLVADRDMLRNLHRNPAYNAREEALRRAMEAMAGYVVSRRSANQD